MPSLRAGNPLNLDSDDDRGEADGSEVEAELSEAGPDTDRIQDLAMRLQASEQEVAECQEAMVRARRALATAQSKRDALAAELDALQDRDRKVQNSAEALATWGNQQSWSAELRDICRHYFGVTGFRVHQEETVNALLGGRDVLLVAPTGSGKSLCFQAPPLLRQNLALVVSPLLSLMHDQVMSLKAIGVNAAMLSSSDSREKQNQVRSEMKALAAKGGKQTKSATLRVLYVTPERLAKSKLVMSALEQIYAAGRLGFIAIDEAHCVSQWGHDFRQDYERLAALRVQFAKTPILALTATATPNVAADVQRCLGIRAVELRSPTDRPNLFYAVRHRPKAVEGTLAALGNVIRKFPEGTPGIVYCITRKEAEMLCEGLRTLDPPVRCKFYHGDLDHNLRQQVHSMWMDGKISVVVATVAFGMGINKPDVRFVIHAGLPASLHHYYQEAGRAGRDGQPALCLLLYRPGDVTRHSVMNYYKPASLQEIYGAAMYCQASCCRRTRLSEHFGEKPPRCDRGCDVCWEASQEARVDPPAKRARASSLTVSGDSCLKVLQTICSAGEEITTLNKLSDTCQKACGLKGEAGAEVVQHAILALLAKGYLSEEFKHSPYATNAYLAVTSSGSRMAAGGKLPEQVLALSTVPDLLRKEVALGPVAAAASAQAERRAGGRRARTSQDLVQRLRRLRDTLGADREVPGHFVLTDDEVAALVNLDPPPKAVPELTVLSSVKRELYGAQVLTSFQV